MALKILPEAVALDSDRLARFTREAQVLGALNHRNIAAIYGLEVAGDVDALVMELVDGVTLAERIQRGPIPLDEALPIAIGRNNSLRGERCHMGCGVGAKRFIGSDPSP